MMKDKDRLFFVVVELVVEVGGLLVLIKKMHVKAMVETHSTRTQACNNQSWPSSHLQIASAEEKSEKVSKIATPAPITEKGKVKSVSSSPWSDTNTAVPVIGDDETEVVGVFGE
jgi:hypothetical protein